MVLGGLGVAGSAALGFGSTPATAGSDHDDEHGNFGAVDEYRNTNFDPHEFLTTFNTGASGQDAVPQRVYEENGRTVREFEFSAVDTTHHHRPCVEFHAWAYNGQVPGPTIRVVEGDLIRIEFQNFGGHAHAVHPQVIAGQFPAEGGVRWPRTFCHSGRVDTLVWLSPATTNGTGQHRDPNEKRGTLVGTFV